MCVYPLTLLTFVISSAYELYIASMMQRGDPEPPTATSADTKRDQTEEIHPKNLATGSDSEGEQTTKEFSKSATTNDATKRKKIDEKHPDYIKMLCAQFKRTLCHEGVRAHFVGAWCVIGPVPWRSV